MNRETEPDRPEPLYIYRTSCVAMLRRYFRMSVELGRLPALLGREFFRSRSDTIRDAWFEDAVIYVHDVENCINCLKHFDQQVIARVVFQDYTQQDAAKLLGCTDRYLRKRLSVTLDVLSQLFLERNMMVLAKPSRRERVVEELSATAEKPSFVSTRYKSTHNPWREMPVEISCQAPLTSQIVASL